MHHPPLDGPVYVVVPVPAAPHAGQDLRAVVGVVPHHVEGQVGGQPRVYRIPLTLPKDAQISVIGRYSQRGDTGRNRKAGR